MIDLSIDAASIRRRAAESHRSVVAMALRRLHSAFARFRAVSEFACVDERLRDDAALTFDRYLGRRGER
jgi:hypothetical protein